MKGFVYLIKAGVDGPVKIGYSENPRSRLYQLQPGHHETLQVVVQFPGFRTHEQQAQERARELGLHLRGEWFTDTPELRASLNEIRDEARQRLISWKAYDGFKSAAHAAGTKLIQSFEIEEWREPIDPEVVQEAFAEAASGFLAAMELFRRDTLEYVDEIRAELRQVAPA